MFGLLKREAIFASFKNICTNSGSSARCGKMRLTTTWRLKPSMPVCSASHTSAMPPVASFLMSWYLPNVWVDIT
jgi:hypothetical protein